MMNKSILKTTRHRAKKSGFVIRYDIADANMRNWFQCRENGCIHGAGALNRDACNRMWAQGELIEVGAIGNGMIYRVQFGI